MSEADGKASLSWTADGVPVSRRFDDPYYALSDGLAESRHVFLDGCGLPGAWAGRKAFAVAELGFGTGLNSLATLMLWRQTALEGAVLDYTGFERWPMSAAEVARALERWPELAADAEALVAVWPDAVRGETVTLGPMRLKLMIGDAREALPGWEGSVDAWFLDGFAPAKNPELWEPALLAGVFRTTRPGGRAATYSAAGAVRRGLADVGFAVERTRGFAGKRHMTRAMRPWGD